MLHLAFLVIAAGCLTAAWWQVHRAMAGNTLSYLYSVEWPAFVVVAGIYVVLTFIASLSLALVGRLAFRVKAKVF